VHVIGAYDVLPATCRYMRQPWLPLAGTSDSRYCRVNSELFTVTTVVHYFSARP